MKLGTAMMDSECSWKLTFDFITQHNAKEIKMEIILSVPIHFSLVGRYEKVLALKRMRRSENAGIFRCKKMTSLSCTIQHEFQILEVKTLESGLPR
jgi:predicted transcriptional regulator